MKKRALIVDDEPHVRLLMERVLSRAGWDVVAVEDIESAFPHVESVDVMIIDFYLGKERGPELVRRAQAELESVPPAVLATGTPDEVPMADWELFTGSLGKPFKVEALVDEITQALSAKRRKRSGTRRKSSMFASPKKKDEAV